MEHMWAPWRIQYIEAKEPTGCILCQKPAEKSDAANYIVYRGERNFVMLNGFPYNPGHLLISPYRHVAGMEDLTREERNDHFEIVSQGIKALRQVYAPTGFNIGINSSRVAGAGIDERRRAAEFTQAVFQIRGERCSIRVPLLRILRRRLANQPRERRGQIVTQSSGIREAAHAHLFDYLGHRPAGYRVASRKHKHQRSAHRVHIGRRRYF